MGGNWNWICWPAAVNQGATFEPSAHFLVLLFLSPSAVIIIVIFTPKQALDEFIIHIRPP